MADWARGWCVRSGRLPAPKPSYRARPAGIMMRPARAQSVLQSPTEAATRDRATSQPRSRRRIGAAAESVRRRSELGLWRSSYLDSCKVRLQLHPYRKPFIMTTSRTSSPNESANQRASRDPSTRQIRWFGTPLLSPSVVSRGRCVPSMSTRQISRPPPRLEMCRRCDHQERMRRVPHVCPTVGECSSALARAMPARARRCIASLSHTRDGDFDARSVRYLLAPRIRTA